MLQEITIKNFKSIAEDTIELGRVNVFIGENGCGKSNILEAVGFASAALLNREVNKSILIEKGIRIAKPSLMINSFKGKKQNINIDINAKIKDESANSVDTFHIKAEFDEDDINSSKWLIKELKWGVLDVLNFEETLTHSVNAPELQNLTVTMENLDNQMKHELITPQEVMQKFRLITEKMQKYESIMNTSKYYKNIRQIVSPFFNYLIYCLNTPALRDFTHESKEKPVGIYGEKLDELLTGFDEEEHEKLKKYSYLISWLEDYLIDVQDILKFKGFKQNSSKSTLYFSDKFMARKNNIFSVENANEGILHVLFYLAVMISKRTPKFFAIDNIESCLNPHLCRHLMEQLCVLAKENDKQLLITTHNPAILDGLNLFDEEIRLFEVKRNDNGHTKTRRIKLKPDVKNDMGERYKLSELWTRGFLGAISQNF